MNVPPVDHCQMVCRIIDHTHELTSALMEPLLCGPLPCKKECCLNWLWPKTHHTTGKQSNIEQPRHGNTKCATGLAVREQQTQSHKIQLWRRCAMSRMTVIKRVNHVFLQANSVWSPNNFGCLAQTVSVALQTCHRTEVWTSEAWNVLK